MAAGITNVYADQNRRTYEDYEPFLLKRITTTQGTLTLGEYCSKIEASGYGNKPWNVTGGPSPIAREKATSPNDILTRSRKSLMIYGFIGRDLYHANVIHFLRAMPQQYLEDWPEIIPANPFAGPQQPTVRRESPSIEDISSNPFAQFAGPQQPTVGRDSPSIEDIWSNPSPQQDYLATPEQPVVRRAHSIEEERIVAQENTPAISRIDSNTGNVARRLEF